jgi:hypothetical protein
MPHFNVLYPTYTPTEALVSSLPSACTLCVFILIRLALLPFPPALPSSSLILWTSSGERL